MKRKLPKKLLSLLLSGILMVTSLETSTVYAAEESVSQESITDSIDPESETEITTNRPQEETTSPETQTETDIASAEQPTENVSSEHEEEYTSSEQSTEKSSSELPTETVSSETEQENDTLIEESATEAIEETVTSSSEDETEETTEEIKTVETSKTQSVIVVNPLYEGIIDPDDLAAEFNSQEDSIHPLSGEDAASFQTFEDAAKYLREQMVARVGTVSIQVPTSVSTGNGGEDAFPQTLFDAAIAHTEECSGEEGDALAWQHGGAQMSMSYNSNTYTTTYTISYYTTRQQEQELTAKVNEALKSLALSSKTDYQKVKAIHDYICDNVDYDYDNLKNDAYKIKFTAYGALCTGKAVCQGYAVLFYRMCKEAGLPVRVITGIGNDGKHAWNIVKIGNNTRATGKYYNIDCTWDGQDAETYHTYFLLNEADFKDHIRNDKYDTAEFHAQYPMAETSYIDESAFESGLNTDNPDVSFTALDDTTISSSADGKPKLLVFFKTDCGYSRSTIRAIAGNNFSGVDIYAVEINNANKEAVSDFKNTYGSNDIIFSYDTTGKNSTSLFRYAEAGGLTDGTSMSVALPVLCYIDTNNKLQYVTQGLQNASEIKANLDHYCGAPSIVQHKITYVLDGGSNNSSNPSTYEETTGTIILNDPTKTGYTFAGWYLDAAFTQKITQIDKGTSGDITLYAKWTADAAADKLNLDNLDIDFTSLDDNYISSKADGKPKLIIFFSHKCSNSQRTIQGIRQGIQNVDIFAIETLGGAKADVLNFKNTYGSDAIVFSYDDYGVENTRYLNDYVNLANHNSITPPTICYIDADNKLQHITNGYRSASDIKTDIDRYCGSSSEPSPADTYTITYVLDGGNNNTSNPATYTTETDTITLQNPTREGYIFEGWYRDAAFTQAITKIENGSSGNLTIYAKWKADTQEPENPARFPEVDMTISEGNILVGISGTSYTETSETILNRLNEIRLEACKEGIKDPNTGNPLTEADYKPLKWSSDLEAITRLRAAEAAVRPSHTRPNDNSCFTAVTTNGEQSWGENLAWNYSDLMSGIELWYGEKNDWVNSTPGKTTGHYENIINTRYNYVAVSAFKLPEGYIYPIAVAQEFSDKAAMDSQKSDFAGSYVQNMEIAGNAVSNLAFPSNTPLKLKTGSSYNLTLNATVGFTEFGKTSDCTGPVREGAVWKSSDASVAAVDAKGHITALKSGTALITAAVGSFSAEITVEVSESDDNQSEEEVKYTVTFDTQGHGMAPQPITNIKSGDRITKPADPSADGYRFDGWYQDASCQNAWNFSTDTVQADITLYAKWVQTADENEKENDKDDSRYPSDQRKSLKSVNAAIANIKSKVYDGNPYKPAVKVTANDGGRQITLAESTDYKVLYENNVNAGTGKVIVRGIGTYSGEITKEFSITRKPFKKLNIVTGGMAASAASDLPVYVYDGTKLLQKGADYTLSNLTDVKSTSAKVTVTAGKNSNYDGSVTVKITLYTADADKIINPDNVTLSANSASYTGKAVTSIVPTVKIGNATLEKNKHYKVQYKNNTKAGTALVIITGKGQYKGKVVKSFTITASKSKLTVRGISDKTYNGKLQKPTVTVLDGTKKLKVNKDYTVTYEKNLLAGKTASDKAIVKITGIGNYEGAYTETTFTIQPQKMSKASFKADKKSGITLTYNKKLLTEGIDYTLTYGETKKGKVQVKITGINDFTGEMTKSVKENIISANS